MPNDLAGLLEKTGLAVKAGGVGAGALAAEFPLLAAVIGASDAALAKVYHFVHGPLADGVGGLPSNVRGTIEQRVNNAEMTLMVAAAKDYLQWSDVSTRFVDLLTNAGITAGLPWWMDAYLRGKVAYGMAMQQNNDADLWAKFHAQLDRMSGYSGDLGSHLGTLEQMLARYLKRASMGLDTSKPLIAYPKDDSDKPATVLHGPPSTTGASSGDNPWILPVAVIGGLWLLRKVLR